MNAQNHALKPAPEPKVTKEPKKKKAPEIVQNPPAVRLPQMTTEDELQAVWLTKDQLRLVTAELGTNVVTIARAMDVDERTARRWSSGEMLVPAGVSVLIRLLLALKRKLDYRQMTVALRAEADLLDKLADAKAARLVPNREQAKARLAAAQAAA